MGFIDRIIDKARQDRKTIVLPEASDARTIEAAAKITQKGIADVVLIGKPEQVQAVAPQWDIGKARILDPMDNEYKDEFARDFAKLREKKGVTLEQAQTMMENPLYFAVMLVRHDIAQGMVAGAINSTSDTLRPALQILKTAPGTRLVSSFFMMIVPDCPFGCQGTFLFSDCGLMENPDADQLSDIALSSAKSFQQLTAEEAKVAMLSYSTLGSAQSELTDKVVQATRLAREKAPQLALDGELQLDAAIVPAVAESKAAQSDVAGKANVLIFPDLDAGNIGYKLVQRLAKAEAYGPITQGIARPVNDLSRGCSADDIVGVAAITAVQAQ